MPKAAPNTTELLDLWQGGNSEARDRLLDHCCHRMRVLARTMLRRHFPHVGRWETTDDVLQQAMLRLHKSLEKVELESGRHFYNLAATQIRRELIDLARHYFGPQGQGTKHETDRFDGDGQLQRPAKHDRPDVSTEPSSLAEWAEFHQMIGELPETERQVVELLWYQGMGQLEAAQVLGITDRTVRRRWVSAKSKLFEALSGEAPGE